jgi:hypothetical protein
MLSTLFLQDKAPARYSAAATAAATQGGGTAREVSLESPFTADIVDTSPIRGEKLFAKQLEHLADLTHG